MTEQLQWSVKQAQIDKQRSKSVSSQHSTTNQSISSKASIPQSANKLDAITIKTKDSGTFGFLNQKLSQWPIWNKITQLFGASQARDNQTQQQDIQQQVIGDVSVMKLNKLPWDMFTSRGGFGHQYEYYFSKINKQVYFYQVGQFKDIVRVDKPFRQITQPPKNYKGQRIYSMPLKEGKALIKEQFRYGPHPWR